MNEIIEKIKCVVEQNGPNYIFKEPYEVYKEINDIDPYISCAILATLAEGSIDELCCEYDREFVVEYLENKLCFKKEMATNVTNLFFSLYSNKEQWEEEKLSGWNHFVEREVGLRWNGFSVWNTSCGSVNCYCESKIKIIPKKEIEADEVIEQALQDNPFLKEDYIIEQYQELLSDYLDNEFEKYCSSDFYYEPLAEEFEIEYYIEKWCDEHGFEFIECDWDGYNDAFEPSFYNTEF